MISCKMLLRARPEVVSLAGSNITVAETLSVIRGAVRRISPRRKRKVSGRRVSEVPP